MATNGRTRIRDLLAAEVRAGTLNLNEQPRLPSVPSVATNDMLGLKKIMAALKGVTDLREGRVGSVLDRALTLRDLIEEGALSLRIGANVYVGNKNSPLTIDVPAGGTAVVGNSIALSATGFAFVYDSVTATTSASPTITFTAIFQGYSTTPTATFTAEAFDASGTSQGYITLGGSGNTRTLTSTQFNSLGSTTTKYVLVIASYGSLADATTIYRGDNGSDSLNLVFGNETATVPTDSSGGSGVFTNANTQWVRVYEGINDTTNTWTFSRADTNCTSLINGVAGPVSGTAIVNVAVSAMSADLASVAITATRGSVSITKPFRLSKSKAGAPGANGTNGTNGTNGARGSVQRYISPYSSWDSTAASAAVPGGVPIVGDTVCEYDNVSFAEERTWTGSAWVAPGTIINGSVLVNGTVTASKINVVNLAAVNANLGTVNAGSITGTAFINTNGYVRADGSTSLAVDPLGIGATATAAVAGNMSGSAELGVFGRTTVTGGSGVYGWGPTNGTGGTFYGGDGLQAIARKTGGVGILAFGYQSGASTALLASANNSSSGSIAVDAQAFSAGQVAVKASSTSGTALQVVGSSTFSGQAAFSASGVAPFSVASSIQVSNLNAQYLGGNDGTYYRTASNLVGDIPAARMSLNVVSAIGSSYVQNATYATTSGLAGGFSMVASAGSSSVVFPGNNKPGSSTGLFNDWFVISTPGGTYCVPAWLF